jgi:hypothetical protein
MIIVSMRLSLSAYLDFEACRLCASFEKLDGPKDPGKSGIHSDGGLDAVSRLPGVAILGTDPNESHSF